MTDSQKSFNGILIYKYSYNYYFFKFSILLYTQTQNTINISKYFYIIVYLTVNLKFSTIILIDFTEKYLPLVFINNDCKRKF